MYRVRDGGDGGGGGDDRSTMSKDAMISSGVDGKLVLYVPDIDGQRVVQLV